MNRHVRAGSLVVLVVAWAVSCASCLGAPSQPLEPEPLDFATFRCRVQPVLTQNCGTFACHGDARRFFVLFGRNRLRLGGAETERNAPLSTEEIEHNYLAASAMIDPSDPERSPLLLKPLEPAAGGWFHVGATRFGGANVFESTDDRQYRVLRDWAMGLRDPSIDDGCIEPGSDL